MSDVPTDGPSEDLGPPTRIGPVTVPSFVTDLGREPGALMALVAGSIALFVAGLDPKVFGPGTASMQLAIRERPALESLYLLTVVIQAGFYLVGGAAGDIVGSRRVLLVGLVGLVVGSCMAVLWSAGPLFITARVVSSAAIGLVIPTAIATVAVAYTGATRATALGVAYAMLGLSSAIAPALLSAVQRTVGTWPSFLLVALVAVVAVPVARRARSAQAGGAARAEFVVGHGLWAFGLLSMTTAVVGLQGGQVSPIRVVLFVGGLGVIVGFLAWQRRVRDRIDPSLAIDLRPVTVALFAGVVVAFAQIAPSLEAPVFFQVVQGWGSLAATIAIAPFVIALLVAGPVAGILLRRYRPRTLIAGGMLALGIGDLAFALVQPSTPYFYFIVPFVAIGAGFVIATTVRTAIIFASVPRRLPGTAAALNQTSLLVGSQLGVAVVTTLVSVFATQDISVRVASAPADQQSATLADFARYLEAVGTSTFGQIVDDLASGVAAEFSAAYASGLASSIAIIGAVTIVGALVAWLGMGRSEAVVSVWEHRDERGATAARGTAPSR